jgi:hypothetical protein
MNAIAKLGESVFEAIKSLGPDCEKITPMVLIGNGKTGKSLENSGGCPLMKKVKTDDGNTHVTSPLCPSCYAVSVMNNYPQVRRNIETHKHSVRDIILLAAHMHPTITTKLSGKPVFPGDRLRIYGVTDFSPMNMGTLKMLSRVYQIDIISKTLWMGAFNRTFLLELAKLPGINISLSFNQALKDAEQSRIDTMKFCLANKIGDVVNFNYTFTTSYRKNMKSEGEPIRDIKGVGVYHITSPDKHKISKALGGDDSKVCGIFTESGTHIDKFEFKKTGKRLKGSCLGCNFCRDNTLNAVLGIGKKKRRKVLDTKTSSVTMSA